MRKASFLGSIALLLAGLAAGGEAIPNWSAPATWSPAKLRGGLTAMDVTNPIPFIGVTPCRVADTRGNGFIGPYGPPALVANANRSFTITGQCGIPANAAAVSFNFTALNVGGGGDLRVFPAGGGLPLVSTINYNANTPNIANAAVVPLGTAGAITVRADAVPVDLIIDVNGYYYDGFTALPAGEQFRIIANISGGGSIYGLNTNAGGYGVWGNNVGGIGVYGTSTNYNGVWASSTNQDALAAFGGRDGGYLQGNRHGVIGTSVSTSGTLYGVLGSESSGTVGSSGVIGLDVSAYNPVFNGTAGVAGSSQLDFGVYGQSRLIGVIGQLRGTNDGNLSYGLLGTTFGTAADLAVGPWGVFAGGNLGATGAKHFVEPHAADPTKVILYSSLEGREVGTYFRARARCTDGVATVPVPEDFAMVTDEGDLSVQATAIGKLANFAVERLDLSEVVLACSRNVEVFVTVNGIRRAFKDFEPVVKGAEFAPRSAQEKMPAYLTEEAKRRLIANGTYNADGSVNMATAERAGWTRAWKEREESAGAAAASNAAARAARLAETK